MVARRRHDRSDYQLVAPDRADGVLVVLWQHYQYASVQQKLQGLSARVTPTSYVLTAQTGDKCILALNGANDVRG